MGSVLGVDVGGTKVAVVPVDRGGAMLAEKLVEPSETSSPEAFLASLDATLRHALVEFEAFGPGAVGVACAGTVDVTRGVVVKSPNLPLVQVAVAGPLSQSLGMPVALENDAKAAVWGESFAGAAIGLEHVVMITLGTGVGGGLLLNGRVYRGADGGAGELGHLVVQPGGLPCGCGGRGCLEMYASGRALARYAAAHVGDACLDPDRALVALAEKGPIKGSDVSRLALSGYPGAREAVKELAGWVGIALVSVSNAFNPQMIVVGGGVSELGEQVLEPATEYLRNNAIAPGRDTVEIMLAELGNDAGLVGAGLAGWEALDRAGA